MISIKILTLIVTLSSFTVTPSFGIVQNYWEIILRHENVLQKLCTGEKPSQEILESYFQCQVHGETEIEKSYGGCINSLIPNVDDRYTFTCNVSLPDTHAKDEVTDTKIESCRKKECFENSTTDCLEIKIGLGVLSCQEKVLGIKPEAAIECKELSGSFLKSEEIMRTFCEENITISDKELEDVHHCLPYVLSKNATIIAKCVDDIVAHLNEKHKEENVRADYFCEKDFMIVILDQCLGRNGLLNLEFNEQPLDGYHFYLDSMRKWTGCIEKSVPGLLERKASVVPASSSIKVTKGSE